MFPNTIKGNLFYFAIWYTLWQIADHVIEVVKAFAGVR